MAQWLMTTAVSPGMKCPAIVQPWGGVMRVVFPGAGGWIRSVSLRTASMYSSELTRTAVISDSLVKAPRISLMSLDKMAGLMER